MRWRGVLTLENVQTGDGRVFAPNSIEWADLPLPLAWLRDGDQHVNLTEIAPVIGTITAISREGDQIMGEGEIDENNADGAEVIRMMTEGTAPLGARFPVSIDGDNWEVEIVLTDAAEAEDVLLLASGRGPVTAATVREAVVNALRAAAGDPDPGEDGGEGGEVLFQDSVDEILERYTRLRIRGATCCAVAAFDEASIELMSEAATAALEPIIRNGVTATFHEQPPPAVVAAPSIPARPPVEWFRMAEPEAGSDLLIEQIDGSWAVPLTITDDGRCFGHIARVGQNHRGYSQRVTPPRSANGYREFHVGHVICEDGTDLPTGALIVGTDHADLSLNLSEGRDHYANSGMGFADGRVTDGEFGPWFAGALRPDLTDNDLRVLRALSLSGDWRWDGRSLEMCAVLAVNTPGFPIAREAMAASAYADRTIAASVSAPMVRIEDGQVLALVSAGTVTRCGECAERARAAALVASAQGNLAEAIVAMQRTLNRIERRTRPMEPLAAAAIVERVSNGASTH